MLWRLAAGRRARLRQGFGAQPSLFGPPADAKAMAGLPAEALAKAGKMSTFVSGKTPCFSTRYEEFMSTFVYLPEKAG
jgi:hypothetical protein